MCRAGEGAGRGDMNETDSERAEAWLRGCALGAARHVVGRGIAGAADPTASRFGPGSTELAGVLLQVLAKLRVDWADLERLELARRAVGKAIGELGATVTI